MSVFSASKQASASGTKSSMQIQLSTPGGTVPRQLLYAANSSTQAGNWSTKNWLLPLQLSMQSR